MATRFDICAPRKGDADCVAYNPETGKFRWAVGGPKRRVGSEAGSVDARGYRRITINGVYYLAHRLAWLKVHGESPVAIDHINGDKSDNRISNLRPATIQENGYNRAADRTAKHSKFKGVDRINKLRPWRARIGRDHIGTYQTEEEAAMAYDIAAIKRWPDFAQTNFPKEQYNGRP